MKIQWILQSFLSLICIFQFHLGFSQTFEKYYKTSFDDLISDAIEINNQEIIFALNYGDYVNSNYDTKLIKINQFTGNIVDSCDIIFSNNDYKLSGIGKLFLINQNKLVVIGHCSNNYTSDKQIFISHYNFNLEQVMDTIVGDIDTDESFFDVIVSSDSLLVFAGRYTSTVLMLEERDINGVLIRDTSYTNGGMLASTVAELPNENKYHLYRYWDNDHSFYIIDKEDLTIDTVIEYPQGFLPRNAVNGINSDSYYVAGRKLVLAQSGLDNLSYIKVSSTGEITQLFEYFTDSLEYYTNNCLSINSNYIYYGGSYNVTWTPPLEFYPEQRWILLFKTTHNGDIVWQKFYKGDVNYMPHKILATSDGGAMVFSPFYDWNNPIPYQRDLHILKIDSLGYYTPLTGTEEEFEQMNKQILVYPNPAKDKVNFVFGLYQNLEINLFNLQGELILSEIYKSAAKIDISHLPTGTYIYKIAGKNGFFEEGKLVKQ